MQIDSKLSKTLKGEISSIFFRNNLQKIKDMRDIDKLLFGEERDSESVRKCFSNLTLVTDDPDMKNPFECVICHSVVYEPRECCECSTLFC
jgi:hypothetical protein